MTLLQLNQLSKTDLSTQLASCCGASNWVHAMVHFRPYASEKILFEISDVIWSELGDEDYLEAFTHHPMIGDLQALQEKFASTATWAGEEQQGSQGADELILRALQQSNQAYLDKFGFIFIVCATGKTAEQMLAMLQVRLNNDAKTELATAAAEQHKITQLRLKKLLNE